MGSSILGFFMCDCFLHLKLAPQFKCQLLFISVFLYSLLIGLFTLMFYLISLSIYKDIANTIDSYEVDELSYVELYLENNQLILEETYKDAISMVSNLFENYNRDTIYQAFLKDVEDTNKTKTIQKQLKILLTLIQSLSITHDPDSKIKGNVISCIFGTNDNNECYFFNSTSDYEINGIDNMKEYLQSTTSKIIKNMNGLKPVFPNILASFENPYTLPVFDEQSTSSERPINDEFINAKSITFSIIPKEGSIISDSTFTNNEEFYSFFILESQSTSDLIYDSLFNSNLGIYLLKSNYFFPYQLHNQNYCRIIKSLNKESLNKEVINNKYTNIDECLDSEEKIENYQGSNYREITFLEDFLTNFKLFSLPNLKAQNISQTGINDITKLIQATEKMIMRKNESVYNQTITLVLSIRNVDYKIMKSFSPLSAFKIIDYFYPFSDFSLNFLIKDQGHKEHISSETTDVMLINLVNCVIYIEILMILSIVIVLGCNLSQFRTQIEKAVNILNDTKFLNGITNQNDNKTNKLIDSQEPISDIDEFKELIQTVNEMIKGEFNYQNNVDVYYINELDKDFERMKLHCVLVKEDEIRELIREKGCISEITRISLEEMKKDKFVKKSTVFKTMISEVEKNNGQV